MRRLQSQMRRAPEGEKGKIETQLEELDDKMPPPLTAIYTVKNDREGADADSRAVHAAIICNQGRQGRHAAAGRSAAGRHAGAAARHREAAH